MEHLSDNGLLEMFHIFNYGETQTERSVQHQSRPPGVVLLGSGTFGSLRSCTVRAALSSWDNFANTPLREPWILLIHNELLLLGGLAHLTLEVI